MITIIITSFHEEKTIKKCINSILSQKIKEAYELLLIAPDDETLNAGKKVSSKVKILKDPGVGKFEALNIGFKKAKGRLLILCDGDTYFENDISIQRIIDAFNHNEDLGIISGKVESTNSKNNLLGYWSHLLVNAANLERKKRQRRNQFIVCSGYLIGLRKGIINKLPTDLLSEDAYMSHYVWSKGYDTGYVENAIIKVKYPTNYKDWIKQKRRSAGGYHQLSLYFKKNPRMRTPLLEIIKGPFYALSYAKNIKELFWSLLLFPARIHLWTLTYNDKLKKKSFNKIWQRVESTK